MSFLGSNSNNRVEAANFDILDFHLMEIENSKFDIQAFEVIKLERLNIEAPTFEFLNSSFRSATGYIFYSVQY